MTGSVIIARGIDHYQDWSSAKYIVELEAAEIFPAGLECAGLGAHAPCRARSVRGLSRGMGGIAAPAAVWRDATR